MAKMEEKASMSGGLLGVKDMSGPGGSRSQAQTRGQNQSYRLIVIDRATMTVTGVKDVMSFDETEVLLETGMGMLTIRGSDLHVSRLTLEKGEVDVAGKVDSLTYADVGAYKRQGESFFGRLFR